MSYRYFASRTIYQIVAVMETLFSIVILVFACKTLKVFHDQDKLFQSKNQILLYSGSLGIAVSLVQISASVILIWSTRGPSSFDKDDLAVSRIPTVWFSLAFVNFGLLVFIFLGPLLHVERPGQLQNYDAPLRESISGMFTYVVANALFKFLFIWAMYTTIRCRRIPNHQR